MNLSIFAKIARAFALCACMVTATVATTQQAEAQDLIARQAPVDRKLKAVDSVTINKALRQQRMVNYEQTDLYSSWVTNKVHCYSETDVPDHYRIDLRGFCMPTPSRVITSNYGYRPSFGRMHKGLDIKVYTGDTIVSAFDGKVRVVSYEAKGYGNYVVIRHNNGLETIYGHLSKHCCKVGDVVKAGQCIGLGGNTGLSTGSHLHFETRIMGIAINPALLFDFAAQDVTCDFYDFYHEGKVTPALAAANETHEEVIEQPIVEPEPLPVVEEEKTAPSKKNKKNRRDRGETKVYKVKKGDTLYSISKRVGTTVDQICSRNNLNKHSKLQLGQILRY